MDGGSQHCIRGSDQEHPQEKEIPNGKMSEEALKIVKKKGKLKKIEKRKYIFI